MSEGSAIRVGGGGYGRWPAVTVSHSSIGPAVSIRQEDGDLVVIDYENIQSLIDALTEIRKELWREQV